jgi:hypothetical protein
MTGTPQPASRRDRGVLSGVAVSCGADGRTAIRKFQWRRAIANAPNDAEVDHMVDDLIPVPGVPEY